MTAVNIYMCAGEGTVLSVLFCTVAVNIMCLCVSMSMYMLLEYMCSALLQAGPGDIELQQPHICQATQFNTLQQD